MSDEQNELAKAQAKAPEKTVNVLVKGFAGGDYKTKADEEFCRAAESLRELAQPCAPDGKRNAGARARYG